jgi:hypothetical protein
LRIVEKRTKMLMKEILFLRKGLANCFKTDVGFFIFKKFRLHSTKEGVSNENRSTLQAGFL